MQQMTDNNDKNYWNNRHKYWNQLHAQHKGAFSAVGYCDLGEGFNREAYSRLRLPAVRRLLRRQRLIPTRVLEAGVGTGAYASLWEEFSGSEWVGIDISPVAVEELRRRFQNGRFFALDLTNVDQAISARVGKNFCVVSAIDVLYHIVDDSGFAAALIWLAEAVRPGGVLLVSDVFTDSPWGRRFSHVRRRPLSQYQILLAERGFELIDREPVFAILGDPVPRGGFHPFERLLFEVWRIVQKSVRTTPPAFRDTAGSLAVRLLAPLDDLIRRTGRTAGINLELALFRRGSRSGQFPPIPSIAADNKLLAFQDGNGSAEHRQHSRLERRSDLRLRTTSFRCPRVEQVAAGAHKKIARCRLRDRVRWGAPQASWEHAVEVLLTEVAR